MDIISVGIGEYKVTSNKEHVLKTYALGSCVAIIIYEKIKKIAGLLHVALPDSSIDTRKAATNPGEGFIS